MKKYFRLKIEREEFSQPFSSESGGEISGVKQGSVLSPAPSYLSWIPFLSIFRDQVLVYHFASDTQHAEDIQTLLTLWTGHRC